MTRTARATGNNMAPPEKQRYNEITRHQAGRNPFSICRCPPHRVRNRFTRDRPTQERGRTLCHAVTPGQNPKPRRALPLLTTLLALSLPGFANAQINVVTRHNNNARTAQYLTETTLTTTNVKAATFGKLFSLPTDGDVYAQPLYISNLAIPGKGTHNVVFIATVNNTLYAYDADNASGVLYWQVNLGPQVPASIIASQNLPGGTGIVSTPAIDMTTKTIYVCNKDYFNGVVAFHLHALDITTGAEKLGGPIAISATVNGTGDGNDGNGAYPFQAPQQHNNRSAITLANGNVYVVFASHEDRNPYHGWVMSYNMTTLGAKRRPYHYARQEAKAESGCRARDLTVDASGKTVLRWRQRNLRRQHKPRHGNRETQREYHRCRLVRALQ